MPKLFGTSGIRGPADTLFTDDFCRRLGFVFGSWLTGKGKSGYVALCNDPRDSGPRLKSSLGFGLAAAGWEILDEGAVPTPALTYFSHIDPRVGGAIAVTGSHIAADLNGTKPFINGEEVTKDHEKEIEALFASLEPPADYPEPVVVFENRAKEDYLDLLRKLADLPYPNWKIVVDTANGTQTQIVRDLFPDLGLDFTCTDYCNIQSPHFVPRDTEVESHFAALEKQVVKSGADLGIGFDADGDRVIFVDETGHYVPGDFSCSLIAKHSGTRCVVTPVSTSSVVEHIGLPVYYTPVGSTHVAAMMKTRNCSFGFEANGGSISAELHYGRDGGTTLIKFLNLLKKLRQPLSQVLEDLPQFYMFRDKTDCPFAKYPAVYEAAKSRYPGSPIDTTDGVKIGLGEDTWLLFRGSGNAPEFRVMAQSPDSKKAQSLGHSGLALVRSITNPHPFSTAYRSKPRDSLGILASIDAFPDQCAQVIKDIAVATIPPSCSRAKNIVISGMGGSGLGGRVLVSLERQTLRIPIVVSTEYHLPAFVDEQSLVVISSYSGDTRETISSFQEARARGAQIYVLTTGGQLAELADRYELPKYVFNPRANVSSQPRMGLGYNTLGIVALLSRCQLIHRVDDLNHLPDFLMDQKRQKTALADLAYHFAGRIPVIVASEHLKGAAHSLKNQFNENSKTFACFFDLPELNHHLLEGLSYPQTNPDNLAFLFIESTRYHPELKASYPATKSVVVKQHIPVHTLSVTGPTAFFETIGLIQSGAYLAYYLSQVNSVDPGPIPWVDWYKDEIRKVV